MLKAIALANKVPEFPFGAVIVDRNSQVIVAEGYNQSTLNPTFHGEMVAINNCAAQLHPVDWSQFDLYTTAEPCAMCQGAIAWAGIANVYYGTSIAFLQEQQWWQIDIRAEELVKRTPFRATQVFGGILTEQCNALFTQAKRGMFHQ
jgi:tRNA(Arg) A34 adenosine deaminase TadA